jgi:hypothetical protein
MAQYQQNQAALLNLLSSHWSCAISSDNVYTSTNNLFARRLPGFCYLLLCGY